MPGDSSFISLRSSGNAGLRSTARSVCRLIIKPDALAVLQNSRRPEDFYGNVVLLSSRIRCLASRLFPSRHDDDRIHDLYRSLRKACRGWNGQDLWRGRIRRLRSLFEGVQMQCGGQSFKIATYIATCMTDSFISSGFRGSLKAKSIIFQKGLALDHTGFNVLRFASELVTLFQCGLINEWALFRIWCDGYAHRGTRKHGDHR